jgi:glutathione S-transferase
MGDVTMLTVHHLGISQSDRIVWLCEELGIDYALKRYERDPATRFAPPEYQALHPFGTAPVITDGDFVLGESAAIMEYLIHRYGSGRLAVMTDEPNYPEYLYWFHFANASLMPAAMVDLVAAMLEGDANSGMVGLLRMRTDRAYVMMEKHLASVPYFGGQAFTAADIIMAFPLTTMRIFVPRDLAPYPAIRGWLQRIGERPAFRRAMAKADPDLQPLLS